MIVKFNKGQSLLEVVFAIGVMALILTAMVSLSITSIRNSDAARNKTVANRYAQEVLDWMRAERDTNYNNFYNNTNTVGARYLCLNSLNNTWANSKVTNPQSCNTITGTIFRRYAQFSVNPEFVNVKVTIEWKEGRRDLNVVHQVDLTDPRAQ